MSHIQTGHAQEVPEAMLEPATWWNRSRPASRQSALERMPKWLICIPLTLQWLGLALRYRSLTLPSSANPAVTSGGLVGEGKLEYFKLMGPLARSFTAIFCSVIVQHPADDTQLARAMANCGLVFPIIAKPDLGLCGYGVRRIDDARALNVYMTRFPVGETVVLQQYLPQDGEAGIFYARDPVTHEGRIIGLALRYFARVQGDGHSTVAQLMAADQRALRLLTSERHEVNLDLDRVPAAGERVRLSTIGSTRVGGLYRDGAELITPALTTAVEAIAKDIQLFHFGRLDVRFDTLAELAQGRSFTIMEVNGAGSEAIQAWDPATRLWAGFQMIFAKQALLFAIGHEQRTNGFLPISVGALFRLNQRQNQLIKQYPPSN